jgi:hypothetical protein
VTPIADGTNTTKVIVAYGWESAGDDTATLDADGSVQLGVKPDGDADTSDSRGSAELDGNGNGNGSDFMRIIAFDVTNRAWDRQNQLGPTGEVFNETGHRNFGDYLNYNSYNEGKGRDTFHSAVNGSLQPTANATFKIDASGNSFLRVASDNEFAKHTTAWRSDTPVVWLGNSQGNDAQFTELTNDYTVNGLITSTLQSDDSVALTGGAHANDKSKIKYRNHNESTWDTNLASGDSLRNAKFDATGTVDANYNAATDIYSESYSKSGDDEVQVTGHVTHIGPVTVGAVGAIGDDPPSIGAMAKTEYELLLEGIFADYDEDGGSDGHGSSDGNNGGEEGGYVAGVGEEGGDNKRSVGIFGHIWELLMLQSWSSMGVPGPYIEPSPVDISADLDSAQSCLDVAGFAFPPADVVNAGISAVRGDLTGAGINMASMIPIGGDGIKAGSMVIKQAAEQAAEKALKGLVDNVAVKEIKTAGGFNHTVKSLDDALATMRKAMPDAVELPRAVAGQPYRDPPPGVKKWFQIHPPEPGVGNNLPHIKFCDWTNGKKGTGGSWGHIFFPE